MGSERFGMVRLIYYNVKMGVYFVCVVDLPYIRPYVTFIFKTILHTYILLAHKSRNMMST
jgi:hypothetical protein